PHGAHVEQGSCPARRRIAEAAANQLVHRTARIRHPPIGSAQQPCVLCTHRLALHPVNASIRLLEQVLPSGVHWPARVPERHPSGGILGMEGMGSGIVIDGKGLILTVNYVLIGARELTVTLLDSREFPATVVRHDFHSGLGLLRIEADGLPVLPLESSRDLRIGEEIFLVASVGDGQARVADGNVTYLGPFDANW